MTEDVVFNSPKKEEEELSKQEVIKLLQSFFSAHPPQSFEVIHKGASNSGKSRYVTGLLKTLKGTFKTSLMIEKGLILEIGFELKK